jgi:uroporphyrinogen-III synthase
VAAIGPASRKAIEKRGLTVEIMPEQYVAESVVKALGNHISGERILLARAKEARDVIPNELRNLGATVDVIEAYETVLPEASKQKIRTVLADKSSRPDIITFTSSSSVKNFFALAAEQALDGIKFASIGPVTSATLRELQLPVHIEAEEYTIPGLVQAIVEAHCLNHEASSSR